MSMDLIINEVEKISPKDKNIIDARINQTISAYQETGADISKLTLNCVTAIASSTARSKGLANQSFLKRHYYNLIGKNQKISAQIELDRRKALYASQKAIENLAKQNLLTFDMITAVNNKLNSITRELDEEIISIYANLKEFAKSVRDNLLRTNNRLNVVERDIRILKWESTIKYLTYNGEEYFELPVPAKIVCITNDFFNQTNGKWSLDDLLLLKTAMEKIGLSERDKFTINEFYTSLIENKDLIERLFKDISLEGLEILEPYEAPLLITLNKINNSEKKYSDRIVYIQQFLEDNAFIQTNTEIEFFDFILDLLVNLKIINNAKISPEIDIDKIEEKDKRKRVIEEFESYHGLLDENYVISENDLINRLVERDIYDSLTLDILKLLYNMGPLKSKEIQENLDVNNSARIRKAMEAFRNENIIHSKGYSSNTKYFIDKDFLKKIVKQKLEDILYDILDYIDHNQEHKELTVKLLMNCILDNIPLKSQEIQERLDYHDADIIRELIAPLRQQNIITSKGKGINTAYSFSIKTLLDNI